MKHVYLLTAFLLVSLHPALGHGLEGQTSTKISSEHKIGTYLAIGNPYPSLIGLNAAYNITNDIRAVVGYGEIEVTSGLTFDGSNWSTQSVKAQTYSAGADYLFTSWMIRPSVGARVGYFSVSGDGDIDVQGFSESGMILSANAGADWIGQSGMYAGLGLNVAMLGGSGSGFFANLGYFF